MSKDLVFKVVINGVEKEIKSLKDLKQAKKEATDAFIAGDKEAAKTLAELKDKTEDLMDATKSLKGDGVEPLTGSFDLFKDGISTGDFEKITTGFKGIGAAMSAIPLLLLVEGFKLLIENFDKVAEFAKNFFNIASDGEKKIKALNAELEKQKEATASVSRELNREIALMEAQGVSSDKILAKKKELIHQQIQEAIISAKLNAAKLEEVKTNDSLYESYLRKFSGVAKLFGQEEKLNNMIAANKAERSKEDVKATKESLELIKDLENQEKVLFAKNEVDKTKIYKEESDKRKQIFLDNEKQISEARIAGAQIDKDNKKLILDDLSNESKEKLRISQEASDAEYQILLKQKQDAKILKEKEAKEDKERRDENFQLQKDGLTSLQGLSDLAFSIKSANLKKGSKEEEEAARQQFKINKALAISGAVMNGAQSILAITSVPDFTLGIATALRIGALAITTAATIAKISATQFQASGGGSSSSSAPVSTSTPSVNTTAPTTQNQQQTTFTGNHNNNFPNKVEAVVVETSNRQATNRVNKFMNESSFG